MRGFQAAGGTWHGRQVARASCPCERRGKKRVVILTCALETRIPPASLCLAVFRPSALRLSDLAVLAFSPLRLEERGETTQPPVLRPRRWAATAQLRRLDNRCRSAPLSFQGSGSSVIMRLVFPILAVLCLLVGLTTAGLWVTSYFVWLQTDYVKSEARTGTCWGTTVFLQADGSGGGRQHAVNPSPPQNHAPATSGRPSPGKTAATCPKSPAPPGRSAHPALRMRHPPVRRPGPPRVWIANVQASKNSNHNRNAKTNAQCPNRFENRCLSFV